MSHSETLIENDWLRTFNHNHAETVLQRKRGPVLCRNSIAKKKGGQLCEEIWWPRGWVEKLGH